MQELLKLQESDGEFELTNKESFDKAVGGWPSTTYKGVNIHKALFGGDGISAMEKILDGMSRVDDYQECYTGYDPKDEVFYAGFDIWTSNGNGWELFKFKVGENGVNTVSHVAGTDGDIDDDIMFYGKNDDSGYNYVKEKGYTHLRLD